VCFYHTLDETIKTLWKLTRYGEPLHLPIDHQLISPLEDAWQACHKALQSAKPADRHIDIVPKPVQLSSINMPAASMPQPTTKQQFSVRL